MSKAVGSYWFSWQNWSLQAYMIRSDCVVPGIEVTIVCLKERR